MNWKFWGGIVISIVLVAILFRGIDYRKLWEVSASADVTYWIPAFLAQYALMFVRALRWQYLLQPVKRIGVGSLFSATTIGFMANNLLPARMGEFVRAYVIGRREGIGVASSFATIVVERIFDIFMVLILTASVFMLAELPGGVSELQDMVRSGVYGLLAVIAGAVVLLFLLVRYREGSHKIIRAVFRPFPARIQEEAVLFFGSLATGLQAVSKARTLLPVLAYSVVNWLVSALPIYIIVISFGFLLPFSSSLLILILLAFAVSVPSSPGYVGPFHYAVYLGLGFYGIGKEEAIGMAIVMHMAQFVPLVVLGLYLLWRENLTLGKIRDAAGSSA